MPGLLSSVIGQEVNHHVPDIPNIIVPLHPLGVRPAGNAYTSTKNLKDAAGLFACLPDELIISVLEHLEAKSLLKVRETCKALYAFSRFDELWKTLFIAYVPLWKIPNWWRFVRHFFRFRLCCRRIHRIWNEILILFQLDLRTV